MVGNQLHVSLFLRTNDHEMVDTAYGEVLD